MFFYLRILFFIFLSCSYLITGYSQSNFFTHDFGKTQEGKVLKHRFIYKNKTAKILTITGVNTSCGCTTSKVEKKKLSPKEKTSIETKFDTKGYSGPTEQHVYLHTDDPGNQIITFMLKTNVIAARMPSKKN
ncbi:MAG: DUF1573 domain-containing protein [Candidatus Omnitrophota bacterium]|jgi:hypothetical protein